jgi:hypothetical protein
MRTHQEAGSYEELQELGWAGYIISLYTWHYSRYLGVSLISFKLNCTFLENIQFPQLYSCMSCSQLDSALLCKFTACFLIQLEILAANNLFVRLLQLYVVL